MALFLNNVMKAIYILFVLFLLTSCRSAYQFTPKCFIVDGDEYFVNVERNLSVYVGDNFSNYDERTKTGLQTAYLSHDDQKIIKKLGYDATKYTVLFNGKSIGDTTFRLISLINNKSDERFKNTKELLSRDGFEIKKTAEGKYYYRTTTLNKQVIYHAMVPFKQQLGREEYVSLIYIIPEKYFKNFDHIEDLAISNASMYRQHYIFTPSRTEILCPDDSSRGHFDYRIPDQYIQKENYTLMKGFSADRDEGKKQLIIYRLVQPGQSYGSFVVCKGNYQIELTDLRHNVIWKDIITVDQDLDN